MHHRTKKIIRRIGFWTAALALLLGVGASFQASRSEQRGLQPAGGLFAVDGARMHLHCSGSGTITVVLEAGASETAAVWRWVQEDVTPYTRVCSYDRGGLGWSDPRPGPRDGAHIAQELDALLRRAGETPPYLLAGHSLGAAYVLAYARRYPQNVQGVVLVDAAHPDETRRLPALGHLRSSARELAAWDRTMDEVRGVDLGSRPLVVLSTGSPRSEQARHAFHDELTALSTDGIHLIVAGDALSLVTHRELAGAVSQSILEVVSALRRETS